MYGYREAGGKGEVATIADLGDSICAYLNQVASQANLSLDRAQPAAHWQGAGRGCLLCCSIRHSMSMRKLYERQRRYECVKPRAQHRDPLWMCTCRCLESW